MLYGLRLILVPITYRVPTTTRARHFPEALRQAQSKKSCRLRRLPFEKFSDDCSFGLLSVPSLLCVILSFYSQAPRDVIAERYISLFRIEEFLSLVLLLYCDFKRQCVCWYSFPPGLVQFSRATRRPLGNRHQLFPTMHGGSQQTSV